MYLGFEKSRWFGERSGQGPDHIISNKFTSLASNGICIRFSSDISILVTFGDYFDILGCQDRPLEKGQILF